MSLPSPIVDAIFLKLKLTYGRDFMGRYEGIDEAIIKADWAHELAGFAHSPNAIKHALEHLPIAPPNVLGFRALCINRPEPAPLALAGPRPSDAEKAKVRAMLDAVRVKITGGPAE
jgi:hypothetical protein